MGRNFNRIKKILLFYISIGFLHTFDKKKYNFRADNLVLANQLGALPRVKLFVLLPAFLSSLYFFVLDWEVSHELSTPLTGMSYHSNRKVTYTLAKDQLLPFQIVF